MNLPDLKWTLSSEQGQISSPSWCLLTYFSQKGFELFQKTNLLKIYFHVEETDWRVVVRSDFMIIIQIRKCFTLYLYWNSFMHPVNNINWAPSLCHVLLYVHWHLSMNNNISAQVKLTFGGGVGKTYIWWWGRQINKSIENQWFSMIKNGTCSGENSRGRGLCQSGKIAILSRMTPCDQDRMELRKVISDAVKILGNLDPVSVTWGHPTQNWK